MPDGHVHLTVEPEHDGMRLDAFIAASGIGISRSFAHKVIVRGGMKVNGKCVKPSTPVHTGDVIEARLPEPEVPGAMAQDIPLDIIYEDDDVLVVNKPAGMVVHPAPGSPDKTLVNALLFRCTSLSGINGSLRPGIVHRLDKDTSGVMVVAKNDAAHQSLSRQIAKHTAEKEYVALVHGTFKEPSGTIRTCLARSRQDHKKVVVAPEGRTAITHWEVIRELGDYTLLRVLLETGRTHQIRVHMKHIGHPVVGDPVYGMKRGPNAGTGQYLHARRLAFTHPTTGERMEFTAPLPEKFQSTLDAMELLSGTSG